MTMLSLPFVWHVRPPLQKFWFENEVIGTFALNRVRAARGEEKLTRNLDMFDKETGEIYFITWRDDVIEVK